MNLKTFSLIAFSALLLGPAIVFAQHKGPRAGESGDDYSARLTRESDQILRDYSTRNSSYASKLQKELPSLNDDITKLGSGRETLMAKTEFMNNVESLRKKDDLDEWVDEARTRWNAVNGGARIGILNPYDNSSFYRYYDTDGNLVVSKVKGDYDVLKQESDAWDQSYKRAKVAAESLNNDYEQVVAQYGRVTAIKAELAESRKRAVQPTVASRPPKASHYFARPKGDRLIPGKAPFEGGTKCFDSLSEAVRFLRDIGYDSEGQYVLRDAEGKDVKIP